MIRKSLIVLSRMWRTLYKPILDNLFQESAAHGVRLTPDAALVEMEQFFKSLFVSVEETAADSSKSVLPLTRRLYFRFDRISFRREAHHYAVDLFYDTYFRSRSSGNLSTSKSGARARKPFSRRPGAHAMSQPKMIREVLLKHGGPLQVEKIAEALKRTFNVNLKKSDITSVIYRAMKGRDLFRRVGVNTFAAS